MTEPQESARGSGAEATAARRYWLSSLRGRPILQYGVTQGVVVGAVFVIAGAVTYGACLSAPLASGCGSLLWLLVLGVSLLMAAGITVLVVGRRLEGKNHLKPRYPSA